MDMDGPISSPEPAVCLDLRYLPGIGRTHLLPPPSSSSSSSSRGLLEGLSQAPLGSHTDLPIPITGTVAVAQCISGSLC
jgi:hypothetical protein